jgi:5-methylcytosine-specific restriction endonuclease McrA
MILKRCSKCGIEKELICFPIRADTKSGYRATCRECTREEARKYRQKHKIEIVKNKRKYYKKNKEKIQIKNQEYYQFHKEELVGYRHNYYKINKEERLKKNREYQHNHSNEMKKYKRRYRLSDKGKLADMRAHHKSRTYLRNTISNLTIDQWSIVIRVQNNRCNRCKKKFTKKRLPTMDHIIPLSRGGDLTFENIQALCSSCNSKKQAKLDLQFIQVWAHERK